MTLKEHIDDIRKRLEQNEFTSEAAVRQGIIDRLLGVLDWPTFDIQVVYPEFPVDNGNVDYALCHPISEPRAFIEVKRVGNIDKGTKQLFDYAYRKGVTNLILTDGRKWRFYHPAGEGSYADRMVAELDFIVGDGDDSSNLLIRYLSYESVKTGKAAKIIAEDYRNIVNQRKIDERLPEVWTELIQEKNEYLLLAMIEKAQDKVGHEPTEEQVLTFLKDLSIPTVKPKPKPDLDPDDRLKPGITRIRVTMSDDRVIEQQHAKDTFVEAVVQLGLEEVMRKNNKIVSKEPFYPHRSNWKNLNAHKGEYYININNDSKNKKRLLEGVAKELGIQLEVDIVDKS